MKTMRLLLPLPLIFALSACNFTLAADITPPPGYQQANAMAPAPQTSGPDYPVVSPDPAKGGPIYAEQCAPCHGESGLGDGERATQLANPVAPIGEAQFARQSRPAEWFRIVTQGNIDRFMPHFSSLDERQRWDVVAYVFSLSAPASSAAQGEAIFQANCTACHGIRGQGDGPQAGQLSAALPDFTSQETMAQRSAEEFFRAIRSGAGAEMPAFEGKLSEDEIWALTDYLRWLTFVPQAAESSAQVARSQETPAPAADTTGANQLSTIAPLGTVSGALVNDSGGAVPQGLLVSLHGFDQMQVILTETTSVDANGVYRFENIEMPTGRIFLATAEYQSVTYGSDIILVTQGMTDLELPIRVYDSMTDVSQLSIDRLHYFFELGDENMLRVAELYIISNRSGRTLAPAGPGQTSLRFSLPDGASNLNIEQDSSGSQRYIMTEDGFGDTAPIHPGEGSYQVLFSYELPYDGRLQLQRPLAMPASAVVILLPEDGIQVKGDTIEDAGTRDVQGIPYHLYSGASLPANSSLSLTISSKTGSIGSSSIAELLLGVGSLALVLVFGSLWLYQHSTRLAKRVDVDSDKPAASAPVPIESAETLMDAILALDDLYQEGQLPQDAYLQRRAELKARLQQVMGK